MSLSLNVSGKYPTSGFLTKGPSPSEWLAKAEEWLRAREGDELVAATLVDGPEGPVLLAQLHPGAEEFQISCPRTGEVSITAATASCGAGYHAHACEIVHALGTEMKVSWSLGPESDDTGYLTSGDRTALRQAMLDHVAALARELPDRPATAPAGVAASPPPLLMPGVAGFLHDGAVSTPLGPRDAAWLARARAGDACAADVVPWPEAGRNAAHHARRGLALAWTEVRWRSPLNETEQWAQEEALRCLAAAREKDPRSVPPHLIEELTALLAGEPVATPASVGYRRREVIARLPGGFRAVLPGSFSEDVDEDGTWHGTDGARAIWVTTGTMPPVDGNPGDATRQLMRTALEGDETFEMREGDVVGRAALREDEDDGAPVWVLACAAARGSLLLRATIAFPSPDQRDWALGVFRSLSFGEAERGGAAAGGLAGISSIG